MALMKLKLPDARQLMKLSQRRLDSLAGLPSGTISQIELGKNARPSYQTVIRIIRGFQQAGMRGLEPEQIFDVSDAEPVNPDASPSREASIA